MKILNTLLALTLVVSIVAPSFAMDHKSKAKPAASKNKKKRKNDKVKVFCCAHHETICPTGYCSKADWKKRWVSKAHLNRYFVRYK